MAAATDPDVQAAAVMDQLQKAGARVFFEKQLTSSDVSASGRVVVPKVRARACAVVGFACMRVCRMRLSAHAGACG